ncbi:MAG: tRNA (adenosine(37)-N6)-threonylcarbamoyltransferase complex dimerization subunit type 1 TsaB [Myxococcota bacterium]|nr:tRNA (adenosine(37)-N6)-threonylcarbamoyltransferase complex dimerization subunit type 1 TsaB [Myxococcota bacterium]
MSGSPLILALETATDVVGVALVRGGEVLAAWRDLGRARPASEALLPAVDAVLAKGGVALAAVEAFAVSIGPGSFTGLRVGVATVKGLAFGEERPVAAVPTLAALAALAGPRPGPVAALLDARRGEVYAAVYPGDESTDPLLEPGVFRPDELAAALPAGGAAAVGEGVAIAADALRGRWGADLELLPPPAGHPDPVAVARLGGRLLAAGAGLEAAALVPRYVRRAEAEVRRTGERFERFDTLEKLP